MLGLDTGWNCHISLANDDFTTGKLTTSKQAHTNNQHHHHHHQNQEDYQKNTTLEMGEDKITNSRLNTKRASASLGRKLSLSTTKSLPSDLKMKLLSTSSAKSGSTALQASNAIAISSKRRRVDSSRAGDANKAQNSSSTQIVKFDLTNLRRKSGALGGGDFAKPVSSSKRSRLLFYLYVRNRNLISTESIT